jgi:hypothetical protein
VKRFVTPLKDRQRIAAYYRERYKRDDDFRLRKVNGLRARLGLPVRASVDEIAPKPGRSHA